MNIGIFGGTFDPVHNGHLMIAQYAIEKCNLDKVLFMTSAVPPHKYFQVTPADLRHRLVSLAVEDYDNIYPFDFELKRDGFSYTAQTLEALAEEYPDDKLFFIMGADSLRDFHRWRNPERIVSLATLIVYPRRGVKIWQAAENIKSMFDAEIKLLNAPVMEISSTDIRDRISEGKSVDFFLPKVVSDEIKKEKLYV